MTSSFRWTTGALLAVSLTFPPLQALPNQAVGIVVSTGQARIGSTGATVGATVFSGDLLTTEGGGSLLVQARKVHVFLPESSAAAIYAKPVGIAIELERGAVVLSSPGASPNDLIEIYASDVKVVPR